jgi:outer membrane autotransporter protein
VADSSYILGDIVNDGEGVLNANLWSLDGNIENNATFNILGGSLTKNITGNGVNIIKDDVTLEGGNFSENSDLEVVSGAELNIGDTEVVVDNANIKGQVALKVTQIKAYDSEYKGGRILVNNADIEGGKVKFTVDAGQLSGRQVTGDLEIVSLREGASGKIVGDYSSLFEENNRYVIEQGSKNGSVVIRNTNSASDVVVNSGIGNRNNANTAQAWDTALLNEGRAKEMQDVLNELSQHNKLGYIKALNGVAPSDNQLALNNSRQINNILSREVMRHYEEDGCSCGSPFKRISSWVQTIGAYSKQDTRVTSTGYSAQTTGLVLGFDSAIDCDTKVGFGYANYRTDADSSYRDTEINGHSLFAYAKYQPSFWYARGLISYSMQDFNERSNVEGVLINTDYDGNAFGVESALGYEYLNGITPEVGVKYIYATSDDYVDSLGQSVDTEGVDVLTLEARVKYEPRWGLDDEYDIRPRAYVGVGYDVVNGKRTTDVSLSDVKYDVFAKDMPRLGFEAGVALEGSVGDLDVSVGYDVDFRKDYQDHTGMIKLRYNF